MRRALRISSCWLVAVCLAWTARVAADPPSAEKPAPAQAPATNAAADVLPPLVPSAPRPPSAIVPPAPPAANPWSSIPDDLIPWRWSLRHDFGSGVGFKNGFTYLEGFIPLLQSRGDLAFGDVRAVNFDDARQWEFNAGFGARHFLEQANVVVGANAFYDARNSLYNTYQQVGLGLEALGERLEFRTNGYFVTGPAHTVVGIPGMTGAFQEIAYSGAEAEVGGRLPYFDLIKTRAYIGYYMYTASESATAQGIRGRFESDITDRISLHASVQRDRLFDTTATVGIAIHFGAPAFRRGSGAPTLSERMGQRVVRDVNIVLDQPSFRVNPPPPPPPPPPPQENPG